MQKPLVFISHITEEKEIALALKKLVETTFLSMIDVFVSSDPTSIGLGRKWLDEITQALKKCSIEIILASPESVKRPWINFEGGSGWIRDIPVIPLCHSGMEPSKLPAPLSSLQAATATDEKQLKLIFPVLAEAIRCNLPEIDYTQLISVVNNYEATSRQIQAMQESTSIAMTNGLSPHELATFVEIAEHSLSPEEKVAIQGVRSSLRELGHRGVAVVLALKMLERKNLVETSFERDWNGNEFPVVRITDEGWSWLESNQDKLALKVDPQNQEAGSAESTLDDTPF